ncbi:MAG: MmcQ/YjbR family DNA-binding protein [Pseudomonadota bacterium]
MTLEDLRELALRLADASEAPHHHLTSFRSNGKIFATAMRDGEFTNVFVDEQTREQALALYPDWCDKVLWGGRVVGVRVLLASADAHFVQQLLENAWSLRQPRAK